MTHVSAQTREESEYLDPGKSRENLPPLQIVSVHVCVEVWLCILPPKPENCDLLLFFSF